MEHTLTEEPGPPRMGVWALGQLPNISKIINYYATFTFNKPRNGNGIIRRRLARKRTMRLITWNLQGISNKMHEILLVLDENSTDFAVLTETKRKGKDNEDRDNYIHLWSGVDKSRRRGEQRLESLSPSTNATRNISRHMNTSRKES